MSAWDISSIDWKSMEEKDISSITEVPMGLWTDCNDRLYLTGDNISSADKVYQCSMLAGSINTLQLVSELDLSSYTVEVEDLFIRADGEYMFIAESSTDTMIKFHLFENNFIPKVNLL